MSIELDIQHEYIERVLELQARIKEIISELEPKAELHDYEIAIEEEGIGTYTAPAVEIVLSEKKKVRIIPVGCMTIGGEGRVDIRGGRAGYETLIYLSEGGPSIDSTIEDQEPLKRYLLSPRPPEGWAWIPRQWGKWHPVNKESLGTILNRVG